MEDKEIREMVYSVLDSLTEAYRVMISLAEKLDVDVE